jgi:stearoyl-CoA desaturase (delta-9 desaturase)
MIIVAFLTAPPPTDSDPRPRSLATTLALGFNLDPLGRPRRPQWSNIVILGLLLPGLSLWAVYRVFTTPTGPWLWGLTAALYAFTLLGVTLGNHRYWTHRGFEVRRPLQVVLAVASAMSFQGDIQQWVMTHRTHHRYADVVGLDPHSPYEYHAWHGYKGLIWAQFAWLMFQRSTPEPHHDLTADRLVQWQRRAFLPIAFGQYVLLLGLYPWLGLNGVLIAGVLRTSALMTATGMVNSVCHRWGSRAMDSGGHVYRRDDSRNNLFVAVVAGGEGNHSWHHADPTCPRHGRKVDLDAAALRAGVVRDRGWRPDATWRVIQALARVGLVHDLRRPARTMYFPARQCTPNPSLEQTRQAWHLVA